MMSVSERLSAIREKLEAARSDNLEAVGREVRKESHEKRQFEDDLDRRCTENDVRTLDTHYVSTQGKRKYKYVNDVGSADEADEEDGDARLRSMKRRARAAAKRTQRKESGKGQGLNTIISETPENHNDVAYGGKGSVSEEAMDRMVDELQQAEKRRGKFKRRRAFYEDEGDITFINEGNRLFNRTLSKHFDKFDSVKEIKDNLERGTA